MDSDNEEELDYIDIFFINNKVKFELDDLPKNTIGMSYIKNGIYWIVVNNFYADLKNQLIDMMVEIIAKSFYDDKKMSMYTLKIK